ncbi:MAG: hypothetical protein A2V67_20240 [Deltaproteobacteria bacterium RBG_13_61_14]|nr:MAG: hypothetical protein A2V67_20240 [Deltaproteobacteria bacterium RBG_13_61_14]
MKRAVMGWAVVWLLAAGAWARVPEGDLLQRVQPGPEGKIDLLTVFAHPDDETFYEAGTLLKLTADPRVRLHILCLTLGDRDAAKDKLGISAERLGRIRVQELEAAAAVLGAEEVIELGYHDQGLAAADPATLVGQVREVMERTGAEVVITHDPYGITGHPDHLAASRAAREAFGQSAGQRLYYVTLPPLRYSCNRLFSTFPGEAERARPTLRVQIRGEKRLKKAALYAHSSQKHFSFWNGLAMKEDLLYNYEYFTLAESK